jgi:3-methyladenine DNA glycosylase AlkC
MELFTQHIRRLIFTNVIVELKKNDFLSVSEQIAKIIELMYDSIPENKRISYGIVHTVKELGKFLFNTFKENDINIFAASSAIFNQGTSSESKTVALCMLSFYGLDEPEKVFPYFEKAANDDNWEVREISEILFRKLIKKHPEKIRKFLLKVVQSEEANKRRFVGETLRPVCENKWFYKNPKYSLSIIKYLFKEGEAYPRTSIGNNLSDLARHLPDMVYGIVEELVTCGDKNSYWIAYRACRNLVKKEPEKVMRLLKTESYKYKDRIHMMK